MWSALAIRRYSLIFSRREGKRVREQERKIINSKTGIFPRTALVAISIAIKNSLLFQSLNGEKGGEREEDEGHGEETKNT